MAAKFGEAMPDETAAAYRRAKLAMITGWSLEYIDYLGCEDEASILEVYEAEQYIKGTPNGNNRR